MTETLPQALGLTLLLWAVSLLTAIVASIAVLFLSEFASARPVMRMIRLIFYILRTTPLLFQTLGFYALLGTLPALACALISLSLNSSAYFFSAFEEAKRQYPEKDSITVFGFSRVHRFFVFELPYVWKNCRYSVQSESILLLKGTSLASLITLHEMTSWAKNQSAESFEFWLPYVTIAMIYILLYWVLRALYSYAFPTDG